MTSNKLSKLIINPHQLIKHLNWGIKRNKECGLLALDITNTQVQLSYSDLHNTFDLSSIPRVAQSSPMPIHLTDMSFSPRTNAGGNRGLSRAQRLMNSKLHLQHCHLADVPVLRTLQELTREYPTSGLIVKWPSGSSMEMGRVLYLLDRLVEFGSDNNDAVLSKQRPGILLDNTTKDESVGVLLERFVRDNWDGGMGQHEERGAKFLDDHYVKMTMRAL